MQYIPCNSALHAQETLFLTQKGTFLPKILRKMRKSRLILICDKIAYVQAYNFFMSPNFSVGAPRAPHNFCHPGQYRANLGHIWTLWVIVGNLGYYGLLRSFSAVLPIWGYLGFFVLKQPTMSETKQ